ncbi:uncharacterized [Tachysurus ichikawai]
MKKVQSQSYANITFRGLAISRAHAKRVSMMEGFLWAPAAGCGQMGTLLSCCPAAVISPEMYGLMDTSGLLVPYCLHFLSSLLQESFRNSPVCMFLVSYQ